MVQDKFPLCARPYRALGNKLNISENEVIKRIKNLKKAHIIRRIGATFDSRKLGWKTTLVAMKVMPNRLDTVAEAVSAYTEVTHNYQRRNEYNLWFTLTCPDETAMQRIINNLKRHRGLIKMRLLPATKIFKLKTDFMIT